jgi:hypothetical protein
MGQNNQNRQYGVENETSAHLGVENLGDVCTAVTEGPVGPVAAVQASLKYN